MIKPINEKPVSKTIEIDLTGPDGNAYVLMGYTTSYAKQLGFDEKKKNNIINEMKSGDYENLLMVFDNYFGSFVTLYR